MKRMICIFLVVFLLCQGIPALAAVEEGPVYYNNDTYATLHSYKNASGVVEVLSHYNGVPVTVIDEYAFSKNTKVEKVILPDTITKIGYEAFAYCTALKEIELPEDCLEESKNNYSIKLKKENEEWKIIKLQKIWNFEGFSF